MPLPVERSLKPIQSIPLIGFHAVAGGRQTAKIHVVGELDRLARKAVLSDVHEISKPPEVSRRANHVNIAGGIVVPVVVIDRFRRCLERMEMDVFICFGIGLRIGTGKAVHIHAFIAAEQIVRHKLQRLGYGDGFQIGFAGFCIYIMAGKQKFRDTQGAILQRNFCARGHDRGRVIRGAVPNVWPKVEVCDLSGVDDAGKFTGFPQILIGLFKNRFGEGVCFNCGNTGHVQLRQAPSLIKCGVVDLGDGSRERQFRQAVAQGERGNADFFYAVWNGQLQTVGGACAVEHIVGNLCQAGGQLDDRQIPTERTGANDAAHGVIAIFHGCDAVGQLQLENVAFQKCLVADRRDRELLSVNFKLGWDDDSGLRAAVSRQLDSGSAVNQLILPFVADGIHTDQFVATGGAGIGDAICTGNAGVPNVERGLTRGAAVVPTDAGVCGAAVGNPCAVMVGFRFCAEQLVGGSLKIDETIAVVNVETGFAQVGAGLLDELLKAVLIDGWADGFCHGCQR